MTDEQKVAYIIAQAAVLNAQVQGMVAENMQRQIRGESMAYTERQFEDVITNSGCHHNAVLEMFRS